MSKEQLNGMSSQTDVGVSVDLQHLVLMTQQTRASLVTARSSRQSILKKKENSGVLNADLLMTFQRFSVHISQDQSKSSHSVKVASLWRQEKSVSLLRK